MKIDWIITLSIKSICLPGYVTVLWNQIYLLTHKPLRFTFSELFIILMICEIINICLFAAVILKYFLYNSLLKISQVWNCITPVTLNASKLSIYLLWPKRNNKNGFILLWFTKTTAAYFWKILIIEQLSVKNAMISQVSLISLQITVYLTIYLFIIYKKTVNLSEILNWQH